MESSLTYQERIPFEMLPFPMGEHANSFNASILTNWPTNPQNEFFDQVGYATRFPNFKYVHLQLIPSIKVGKKISASLGFGPFLGVLVNQKQTTITKEDFHPEFQSFFTGGNSETRVIDRLSYTFIDYGVLPKFSVGVKLTKRMSLSLPAKYYISFYRINDTLVRRQAFRLDNMRWRAILVGINMAYVL